MVWPRGSYIAVYSSCGAGTADAVDAVTHLSSSSQLSSSAHTLFAAADAGWPQWELCGMATACARQLYTAVAEWSQQMRCVHRRCRCSCSGCGANIKHTASVLWGVRPRGILPLLTVAEVIAQAQKAKLPRPWLAFALPARWFWFWFCGLKNVLPQTSPLKYKECMQLSLGTNSPHNEPLFLVDMICAIDAVICVCTATGILGSAHTRRLCLCLCVSGRELLFPPSCMAAQPSFGSPWLFGPPPCVNDV